MSVWKLDFVNDIKVMMKGFECTDVNILWSFGLNVDVDFMFFGLNLFVLMICDVFNMCIIGIMNFRSMFLL